MQSGQLINLSALSARQLQDQSWYKAASVSLVFSPAQHKQGTQLRGWADFISKTQLAVALVLINSCWGIEPVAMGNLGGQRACPQHPASCPFSSGSLGTGGGSQSSLTSLLAEWFCAWMRVGQRSNADLRQVCVATGLNLSLFQRCRYPVRGNRAAGGPVQALLVLRVCSGSGRATGRGLRHHALCGTETHVPTQTLPTSVLGAMEGDSEKVGRLALWERFSLMILELICVLHFPVPEIYFLITSGHAAGAVLGQLCSAPWNMLLPYLY